MSASDINIAEGVALCPGCGELSRLGEVIDAGAPVDELINETPGGCSVERTHGGGVHVRVSTRSLATAAGLSFFALFWNGIVSVFVAGAAAALYTNLVGPLPEWIPVPDSDGKPMPLAMALFLCAFLTPFIVIGLGVIWGVLLALFGKIDVRVEGDTCSVRTGVGPFGWTRRFSVRAVKKVSMGSTRIRNSEGEEQVIVIETERDIKVGTGLTRQRRDWLRAMLHVLLITPDSKRRDAIVGQARQRY
ncbi:MAG: hypothetical protein GC159_21475 [Phycisphaera sp.]|nr:hypothetical protein [Phycisphaera sp.]